jgi:hypothetical protein
MFTKVLKNNSMKKEYIVIGVVALVVATLLYKSYQKSTQKDISNDESLKKDYDELMKKIEKAKK